MSSSVKITLHVVLVVFVVTILCLIIPSLTLLEVFLVSVGGLLVTSGWRIITREVSKLTDLKHRLDIQQEHRELDLELRKQERQLLLRRRTTRNQGASR